MWTQGIWTQHSAPLPQVSSCWGPKEGNTGGVFPPLNFTSSSSLLVWVVLGIHWLVWQNTNTQASAELWQWSSWNTINLKWVQTHTNHSVIRLQNTKHMQFEPPCLRRPLRCPLLPMLLLTGRGALSARCCCLGFYYPLWHFNRSRSISKRNPL